MPDLHNTKILLTGGSGFLGSYVRDFLIEHGASGQDIFIPRSSKYDLRRPEVCREVVNGQDLVIHLAAKVGGIGFNQKFPADLFYDNMAMALHLMEEARLANVKKFVAVGTICAYPKFTSVPFKEDELWNGYPEETNAPYGLAKKMLLVQAQAYRKQHGFNAIYLLPVNLYGPGDNFNPESSHVIPALVRRFLEAKKTNQPSVTVWGTGNATREFCHARDAARGIVLAAMNYDGAEPVNIGSGMEISIKDLVELIKNKINYEGQVNWDTSKPDGQPRRCLDVSRAHESFGYKATIPFDQGISETIDWYLEQMQAQV